MSSVLHWLNIINDLVWGPPLIIFILLVGVYLSFKTKFLPIRYLWYAHKLAFTRNDEGAEGDISHFQALMTALAATIGIGSITGVATAIAIGGLGSLFWMWVSAFVGMATKYSEAILAIKYRVEDENNEMSGGPMYYLEKGLGNKFLAVLFAIFGTITSFGIGSTVQANSVASAAKDIFSINPIWVGLILVVATALPLLGGIKSIGKVVSILVPAMGIFYLGGSLLTIILNIGAVPKAFVMIFKSAFTGQAATGGFVGAGVMTAIQMGMSRGVFSSEAGLGSSPIAAAAAKTDSPGTQALISMSSVFITTGIICTLTGLVIAITNVLGTTDASGSLVTGSSLAILAFGKSIPFGKYIVAISIIPFAYSTILGWAYYGEKCVEYFSGIRGIVPFRIIFTITVFMGTILNLDVVWAFANIMNGLMAFPNLIGLLLMGGIVANETKLFEMVLKKENRKTLTT